MADSIPAPEPSPDAQFDSVWESEWRENLFRAALARIRPRTNPRHYQVFDCCVLQQLPVSTVSQMFGLNAAQVYLTKHRVARAVKRAVQELEGELSQKRDS